MSEVNISRVQRLVDELSFEEKLSIIEYLVAQLRQTPESASHNSVAETQDLYGLWRNQLPEDLDLDALLISIRREWEKEWPQEPST